MGYEAQDTLTDRARPRAEIWRTITGVVALGVGTVVLTALWMVLLPMGLGIDMPPGDTPAGMIWLLSSFLCAMIVLWVVMRVLHRRSVMSLIGPMDLARRQFVRVFAMQAAVITLALVLPSPEGMEPAQHLPVTVWLTWLVPALALLVVQVGVEELVFRGYLQSQLAARVRHPLVWLLVPSVLFAVMHLDPTAGGNRWMVVGVTLIFALVAADLTARSGTLGPAFAIHLANNIGALLLVGARGPMEGLALYLVPVDMSAPGLAPLFAVEVMLILIVWLAARLVLKR
jgi:membrane protease YdiL (CAAX protease family)